MITVTRVMGGSGRFHTAGNRYYEGAPHDGRLNCGRLPTPGMMPMPYTWSGPAFKGMDPSDPLTYTRPWNPQPGMIAQLNYDGAAIAQVGRTPTGLQRGPQQRRPRRLRVSP